MATKTSSLFALCYAVEVDIDAPPDRVWARLTDAAGFPAWNATVTSLEGPIALGQRLAIRVPISDRTFTPTVTEFVPGERMVWSDGFWPMFRGVRTFRLTDVGGRTRFVMEERFEGVMLPMIARTLPDFVPVFDRYAADLVRACAG